MILKIKIKDKKIHLTLEEKVALVESVEILEENNLSEKLLISIEELLKKNKLAPKDIEKMELESDLGENFTTFRIAKAVVETFNFANLF